MGKVYLARHALLRRLRAVKVLDGRQADPQTVARFEREVQVTSQLTHPNTIQIFDFGRSDRGVFYFAMEYVDGPDPGASRANPPASRVRHERFICLRQICGSLKEAHDAGLIHRDIKPANIMICRRGGQCDVVKVLDFGLVKSYVLRDPKLTLDGAVGGTPAYMAPERILRGLHARITAVIFSPSARSVYFLLTGRDAFGGGSMQATLKQVTESDPAAISEVAGQEIPAELEALLMQCLAKPAEGRPADLGLVIEQLDHLASTHPWSQEAAQAWWQGYVARPAAGSQA